MFTPLRSQIHLEIDPNNGSKAHLRLKLPKGSKLVPLPKIVDRTSHGKIDLHRCSRPQLPTDAVALVGDEIVFQGKTKRTPGGGFETNIVVVTPDQKEHRYHVDYQDPQNIGIQRTEEQATAASSRALELARGLCAKPNTPGKIAEQDPARKFKITKEGNDAQITLSKGSYLLPKNLFRGHHEGTSSFLEFIKDKLEQIKKCDGGETLDSEHIAYKDGFFYQVDGNTLISISPTNLRREYPFGDKTPLHKTLPLNVMRFTLDEDQIVLDRVAKVRASIKVLEGRKLRSTKPQATRASLPQGTFSSAMTPEQQRAQLAKWREEEPTTGELMETLLRLISDLPDEEKALFLERKSIFS